MGIALVTGTSSGIGLATAITLARAGHHVFAGMRNLERGAELREAMAKEKLPITVVQLDVDSDTSVEETIGKILGERSQIDVLVNNAGIGGGGPVEVIPLSLFRQIMETNYFGSLRCIKAVLPSMRQRGSGCIVNVTSIAGRFGSAMQSAYAGSKWALEGLSEALAQALKSFGIRVAIVEPGVIATPMTMRDRPKPPPNPYSNQIERITAFFTESLKTQTSPFVVGETIRDIVDGKLTGLRNPSGPDAKPFLDVRRALSDEEWVAMGAASDAEWAAALNMGLGLNMKL
jgi:NAD(P)-dependent dehydrogenase (short-subunit alcohol dehydrogenase family)